MSRPIGSVINTFWHHCFPGLCSACGKLIVDDRTPFPRFSPLCDRCRDSLELSSETLRLGDDLILLTAFEDCLTLRSLVKGWKYAGRDAPLPILLDAMVNRLQGESFPSPVKLIPVPIPWPRRALRGFNQSEVLARGIARRCGCRVEKLLVRNMNAGRQAGRKRSQRLELARREYRARGKINGGGTLILVDDLCTTGATLQACSEALSREGVEIRIALVLGAVKMANSPLFLDSFDGA
jgi:ComF family protein